MSPTEELSFGRVDISIESSAETSVEGSAVLEEAGSVLSTGLFAVAASDETSASSLELIFEIESEVIGAEPGTTGTFGDISDALVVAASL